MKRETKIQIRCTITEKVLLKEASDISKETLTEFIKTPAVVRAKKVIRDRIKLLENYGKDIHNNNPQDQ